MIIKKLQLVLCIILLGFTTVKAQNETTQDPHLKKLQQQFIDLRFGMFIHFNIPTYMDATSMM